MQSLELIASNLKANNFVEVESPMDLAPHGKTVKQTLKIVTELKKYVILENGLEISKVTIKPYNFNGKLIAILKS